MPGENNDKKDFLGTGIYFFDSPIEALDWNIGKLKPTKHSITLENLIKNFDILEVDVSTKFYKLKGVFHYEYF